MRFVANGCAYTCVPAGAPFALAASSCDTMRRRANATTDTSTHVCGASSLCGADPRSHESALNSVAHHADRRSNRGAGR